jgi:hypothetical protein
MHSIQGHTAGQKVTVKNQLLLYVEYDAIMHWINILALNDALFPLHRCFLKELGQETEFKNF